MGIVLPDALSGVLNRIGVEWPNIDEDQLTSAASELRQLAGELTSNTGDAKSQIDQMLSNNSSQSLDLFQGLWTKLANGHLQQLGTGLNAMATGLDISAGVVIALKGAAIVQLVLLAAEIASAIAEAFVTFGASLAQIPIEVVATRGIVKKLLDTAVQQVESQILNALEQPVFNALGAAGQELAGQLVGDVMGTNSGINMSSVASAAGGGFQQGVNSVVGSVTGGAGPFGGGTSSAGGGTAADPNATLTSVTNPSGSSDTSGGGSSSGDFSAQQPFSPAASGTLQPEGAAQPTFATPRTTIGVPVESSMPPLQPTLQPRIGTVEPPQQLQPAQPMETLPPTLQPRIGTVVPPDQLQPVQPAEALAPQVQPRIGVVENTPTST